METGFCFFCLGCPDRATETATPLACRSIAYGIRISIIDSRGRHPSEKPQMAGTLLGIIAFNSTERHTSLAFSSYWDLYPLGPWQNVATLYSRCLVLPSSLTSASSLHLHGARVRVHGMHRRQHASVSRRARTNEWLHTCIAGKLLPAVVKGTWITCSSTGQLFHLLVQ